MEMGRDLWAVLTMGEADGGDILRKLFKLPGLVAPMSEHMACVVLHVLGRASDIPNGGNRRQARKSVGHGGGKAYEIITWGG
jgi:hypothetical protein